MTLYQRISPVYEAVKYEPGMEDGFLGFSTNACPYIYSNPDNCHPLTKETWDPKRTVFILTNTTTGERSVVSQEEFKKEFEEVEG